MASDPALVGLLVGLGLTGAMAARGRSRQAASNNNLNNNARLPQAGD